MAGPPAEPRAASLQGAVMGLAAAFLFGLSAPLAKLLLAKVDQVLLAGLLYLGAALGLWLHYLLSSRTREASLTRADAPSLAAVALLGGVLAPVLMLVGLSRVTALTGSLLLNLEAPLTVLFALSIFREHMGRSAALAACLIFAGALLLAFEPGQLGADWLGVGWLGAACACWALDNNLTQRLSLRDPFAIVRIKTLVAGSINTALGLYLAGALRPSAFFVAGALVLGSLSYGVSVVLDAYALRLVGAAREAAYFATAPFVGALIALIFLGDPLRLYTLVAMLSMVLGVVCLLRERHSHVHQHEAMEHEHLHEHDAHHRHEHSPSDPPGEPHSHWHRHAPLVHDHPHVPDAHHRHRH